MERLQQWQGVLIVGLSVLLSLAKCSVAQAETPFPEWSQPHVTVYDQALVGSQVTVAEVVTRQDGWIVIHRSQADNIGEVIGLAPVRAGVNTNVAVTINQVLATTTLYVLLHIDAGKLGVYEFPGADAPLIVSNPPLLAFQVTGGLPTAEGITLRARITAQGFGLYFPLIMHNPALTGIVNRPANLRAGPSRTFPVVGRAQAGRSILLVYCNQACTWYQLASGEWIAAFLVNGVADRSQMLPLAPLTGSAE